MRLTILGTGTARPVGDTPQSGVLVESGETRVLFDIGSGVASQVEQRMNAADLTGLVVGHFHADHWIDIGPLRYRFLWGERSPRQLPVFTPPGGREKLTHLAAAINERPTFFEDAFAGRVPVVTGFKAPVRDADDDGAADELDADPNDPKKK